MTAWLARITINPRNLRARRDLADVQLLHKTLMKLVPDDLGDHARQDVGLLFRLDTEDNTITALVQANIPLDPTRLPDGYGQIQTRDLAPMFQALRAGQAVRYRIAANPNQRLPLPGKPADRDPNGPKRGKIMPLHGAAAEDWWRRRAKDAGLDLRSLISTPLSAARGGNGIRHDLTRFDGLATITDPNAVAQAVHTGIGKGKPYGGGLLSLAPAQL